MSAFSKNMYLDTVVVCLSLAYSPSCSTVKISSYAQLASVGCAEWSPPFTPVKGTTSGVNGCTDPCDGLELPIPPSEDVSVAGLHELSTSVINEGHVEFSIFCTEADSVSFAAVVSALAGAKNNNALGVILSAY